MFTGIIETLGKIEQVEREGTNAIFWISSPIARELKIDQSVSHNGVCLTIEAIKGEQSRVTAIAETIEKTNLSTWKSGDSVNLERCMPMNGRLDGHIVQGHVDCTATCISKKDLDGSWLFRFSFPEEFAALVIEKGSISINGTSLTLFDIAIHEFSVAIIPYTFYHTTFQYIEPGTLVNIEFDIIGKYVTRMSQLANYRNKIIS